MNKSSHCIQTTSYFLDLKENELTYYLDEKNSISTFELDFYIEEFDSAVFLKKDNNEVHLKISTQIKLEHFESLTDLPVYVRPKQLVILGIISLILNIPITPFDNIEGQKSVSKSYIDFSTNSKNIFIINGENHIFIIDKIKDFIKTGTNNKLLFSIIDRWRKAYYLEQENQDSLIFDDEIILSYFHILELLSNTAYYPKQREKINAEIKDSSYDILKIIHCIDNEELDREYQQRRKIIEEAFISQISIRSKIFYMLEQQGILKPRIQSFIINLIKKRNSIAHGREVFQNRAIFPVKPFFPIIDSIFIDTIFLLRQLTSKVIAKFVGINSFHKIPNPNDNSKNLDLLFPPTFEELRTFIDQKLYLHLTNQQFYAGEIYNISVTDIAYYFIANKKLTFEDTFLSIQNLLKDESTIINDCKKHRINHPLIAILATSMEYPEYFKKYKKTMMKIINIAPSEVRDILYLLEHLNYKTDELRNLLRLSLN